MKTEMIIADTVIIMSRRIKYGVDTDCLELGSLCAFHKAYDMDSIKRNCSKKGYK